MKLTFDFKCRICKILARIENECFVFGVKSKERRRVCICREVDGSQNLQKTFEIIKY